MHLLPGTGLIAASYYPMVDAFAAIFNLSKEWKRVSILYEYPCLIFNLTAMLWCISRQTWTLSRAGFLPQFLSVTHMNSNRVPGRALFCMNFYVLALCFFFTYVPLESNWGPADVSQSICVMSSAIFYSGASIVYLVFHYRFSGVTRPFKSPFGQWGAWATLIVSLLTLIGRIFLVNYVPWAFIFILVNVVIFSLYYVVYGRFHLLPTEDGILKILYSVERQEQTKIEKVIKQRRLESESLS